MRKKRQQGRRGGPETARLSFGPSANPALTTALLDVVETQIRDNTPPEARRTFERLVAAGYTPADARRLIGNVVAQEIFQVIQNGAAYDEQRYITALEGLPDSAV